MSDYPTPDAIAAAVARVQRMVDVMADEAPHWHPLPDLRLLLALAAAHVSDEDKVDALYQAQSAAAAYERGEAYKDQDREARRLLRLPERD